MRVLTAVRASPAERAAAMPGDDVLLVADVTMDRAFDLPAPPETVWPWVVQLGKQRAGWYLPTAIERFLPRRNRATRVVENPWQGLQPGDRIPDYGGPHEYFEAVTVEPPRALVYRSRRGRMDVSWAIALDAVGAGTRVRLRLRLHPVKRPWLAESAGELVDALTIAGMASGLRERLAAP